MQLSITAYDHLNPNISSLSSPFFSQMVSMFSSIIIYTTIPIYVYNVLGNLMVIADYPKKREATGMSEHLSFTSSFERRSVFISRGFDQLRSPFKRHL